MEMDQLREWQSFREWKSGLVKQNFDKVKSEKIPTPSQHFVNNI